MNKENYEYYGLMASTWDLFRGDTSRWEDKFFYLDLISTYGQPVLDVGCGTGRLVLDYLSQGLDVDAIDNSPDMLAICQEKAERLGLTPDLYQQPMELLELPRNYKTIIVPSSSFQLLTSRALAKQAMQQMYDHLLPEGILAMPFMTLWEAGAPINMDWTLIHEVAHPDDGTVLRRWLKNRIEVDDQLEHTQDRYEVMRDGKIIHSELHQQSPATRWYTQSQAVRLYKDAGFANIQVFKGFSKEDATATDKLFTVVGQKS